MKDSPTPHSCGSNVAFLKGENVYTTAVLQYKRMLSKFNIIITNFIHYVMRGICILCSIHVTLRCTHLVRATKEVDLRIPYFISNRCRYFSSLANEA